MITLEDAGLLRMRAMRNDGLDLRRVPIWERVAMVLQRSDGLGENECCEIVLDVEPHALTRRIEEIRPGQFSFVHRELGDGEWHATLTRLQPERTESLLQTALHRNAAFSRLDGTARETLSERMSEYSARKGQTALR